jgi:protein phosphatase
MKLMRKLRGKNVQVSHGLERTLNELLSLPDEIRDQFSDEAAEFLDSLVSHYVLDGGRLVVAHAGMKEEMQGRGSGKVRDFALYGETTGETDEFGLPVRFNWAGEYRGSAMVVYGHTPVPEPEWLNRTVNIDTGCVFGGKLTALRYPEKEFVSVPAMKIYAQPARPFIVEEAGVPSISSQQQHDDLLRAEDVMGKRIITTRLQSGVIIREENATAALEAMSRYAINPKWLIYLPPTMSPCKTSKREEYLERPEEAFSYYESMGVAEVICQEKHMGSRAIVIVCRNQQTVMKRFGIVGDYSGVIYTRTGRSFFEDGKVESEVLQVFRECMEKSGFWEEFNTEWACLDCEIMPWSAKAQELLKSQYAASGASGRAALSESLAMLEKFISRDDISTDEVCSESSPAGRALKWFKERNSDILCFIDAYRRYCWPVHSLSDIRIAPFHLLATEGKVHSDREHSWHMETLETLCRNTPGILVPTRHISVALCNKDSVQKAVTWWEDLTEAGGEGMVVKPREFISRPGGRLLQPAVKVRGREYLRIIYGPEYTAHQHLERLRARGLGAKRSLALQEFSLGIEALERFVRNEPLRKIHECVFGILALESEAVDPRL